jgi:hypothetical protein
MKTMGKRMLSIGLITLVIGIAACARAPQPFEYHDARDEKSGPGLFSGSSGGIVIPNETEASPTSTENESTVNP